MMPPQQTRPHINEGSVETGHVDSNYFNMYNFDPDGYWEGGLHDPAANTNAMTYW